MNKKLIALPVVLLAAMIVTSRASADSLNGHLGIWGNGNIGASVNVRAEDNQQGDEGGSQSEQVRPVRPMMQHMLGVYGVVTAVSGNTITVNTMGPGKDQPQSKTFTVDATNATVTKSDAASSVSNIAVGDMIAVQGTVNTSASTVTATKIIDGIMIKQPGKQNTDSSVSAIANLEGNGQPIVGGTVSAVSGNTVTITNKSNASYTIDVTNAKIVRNGSTAAASNIAVGDTILAQGTFNGTNVAAVNVVDSASASANAGQHRGFFSSIGSFFSHLFGFRNK